MDEDLRRQVERARNMTPDRKVRESLELYDRTRAIMLDGLRYRFPNATAEELDAKYRECVEVSRRIEVRRR